MTQVSIGPTLNCRVQDWKKCHRCMFYPCESIRSILILYFPLINIISVSNRVGHGLDPSMDWIGLDWVRNCNPLFFSFIYFLY